MNDRDQRDTVPAMPVPSRNPIAEMREQLEGNVRERSVAIMEDQPHIWVGLVIDDNGRATRYTVPLMEDEAQAWLLVARRRAWHGAWIPTVCPKCDSIRISPGICETCLRGER
jgi:hypothetical protein